jgi:hypothetical protein
MQGASPVVARQAKSVRAMWWVNSSEGPAASTVGLSLASPKVKRPPIFRFKPMGDAFEGNSEVPFQDRQDRFSKRTSACFSQRFAMSGKRSQLTVFVH